MSTPSLTRLFPLIAVPLLWSPATAFAEDAPPCDAEASAVKQMKAPDPSLRSVTDAEAKDHIKAAKLAYGVGQYDKAIQEYIAAGLRDDSPQVLYNLGQTYRAAKDYEKAIRQYKLFIDRGRPGAEVTALVECHIRTMGAELESAAATAPPTGPADDHGDGGAVERRGDDDGEAQAERPARAGSAPWYGDGLGWGLAGGGAIGTVVGTVLLLDATSLDDAAAAEDQQDVRQQLRDKADSRRLWGWVTTGAGVGLLAAGVVRLIMTPDAAASTEDEGLSLVVGGDGTIGLAGHW